MDNITYTPKKIGTFFITQRGTLAISVLDMENNEKPENFYTNTPKLATAFIENKLEEMIQEFVVEEEKK